VRGASSQTVFQGVFDIGGDNGVEHLNPYWLVRQSVSAQKSSTDGQSRGIV
jgi:hypothetical protein